MDFGKIVEKALSILQLKEDVIKEVSEKPEYLTFSILIVAIAGLASSIGSFKFIPGIITGPIVAVIGFFIGVGILWIIAKIFGGKGDYLSYFKPLAMSDIIQWVTVIPFIGFFLGAIASIWMVIVAIKVTQIVHELDLPKAVLVVLIPIGVVFFLFLLFGAAALAVIGMKGLRP